MPTRIRRSPPTPRADESRYTTNAVARPPTIEPVAIDAVDVTPANRMAVRPPVAAPVVKPTMSGLPNGFRDNVWKSAPDSPIAAPIAQAARIRGSRWSTTISRSEDSPRPTRARTTSLIDTS